jgi:hypothetical protein
MRILHLSRNNQAPLYVAIDKQNPIATGFKFFSASITGIVGHLGFSFGQFAFSASVYYLGPGRTHQDDTLVLSIMSITSVFMLLIFYHLNKIEKIQTFYEKKTWIEGIPHQESRKPFYFDSHRKFFAFFNLALIFAGLIGLTQTLLKFV